jgi:hypothetical protein
LDILYLFPPWILVSLVAASAAVFIFYVFIGHRHRSSLLYWPFGISGFLAGQVVAERVGFEYVQVGNISMLTALAGAAIGLTLAHLLVA